MTMNDNEEEFMNFRGSGVTGGVRGRTVQKIVNAILMQKILRQNR